MKIRVVASTYDEIAKIGGSGSGGGGAPGSVHHTSIGILNDPKFFGMRVDRRTAKLVQAFLKENTTKEIYPLPSNWQVDGIINTCSEVLIEAGERKNLNLFVQVQHSREYFICSVKADEIANNSKAFTEVQQEFTLVIRDSVGREYTYDLMVVNKGQSLQMRSAITFAHRVHMVKKAFSLILRAIKPNKFG